MLKNLRSLLFGNGAVSESKNLARSRLQFVLVQDRSGLTNDEMAGFKEEMMAVIQKYFVVDKQGFDIDYRRQGETTTLLINSPVVVRRQDAIGGRVGARHQSKDPERKKAANAPEEPAIPGTVEA